MEIIFETLEFDKIIDQIQTFASSDLGIKKVQALTPFFDKEKIELQLTITDEALRLYSSHKSVSLTNLKDITSHLKRVEINGVLNIEEILDVLNVLNNVINVKNYQRKVSIENVDNFNKFCDSLDAIKELKDEIIRCIDESGFVKDNASFELKKIRREIKSKESDVKRKLDNILASKGKMLSESIVTIRNDRYVLPVKEEYKHTFKGIVHDQSSSGQTIFIEPQEVVELNNRISELIIKENNEITRILMYLSSHVASYSQILRQNLYFLTEIDFMFAKGKYAVSTNSTMPLMNEDNNIELYQARHPLIPSDEVVANDIVIPNQYSSMVITGPNTGGKTVTLKTIGLFTLMAQSGLHIPALINSKVAIFKNIFADIGDRQSIELNLSTFSSHMVNIINIIDSFDSNSLVLFDELGSGTDPKEGASLAIAILEYAKNCGVKTIATTHYSEMKEYAKKNEDVLNASVEFNIEKLIPTYKLLIGISGHSNALDISSQLGMNDIVISNARSILESQMTESDKMLEVLERNMYEVSKKEELLESLMKENEELNKTLNEKELRINSVKEEYIKKAKIEANKIIQAAEKEVENLIKQIKESAKGHVVTKVKKSLEELKYEELIAKKEKTNSIELLKGDEVEVLPYEQKGILSKKINENEWEVFMGHIKSKVHIDNIIFYHRPKKKLSSKATQKVNKNVPMKLDLRGMTSAEAIRNLDTYLDRVKLVNYPKVTIVHGHGTGAVRNAVVNYLKRRTKYNFRYGGAGEGGTGATVIEFEN